MIVRIALMATSAFRNVLLPDVLGGAEGGGAGAGAGGFGGVVAVLGEIAP